MYYTYTLRVTYDANGGTGAPATQTFTTVSDSTKSITVDGAISLTKPTRTYYSFKYWTSNSGTYYAGNTIQKTFTYDGGDQTKTVALTAQWKALETRSTWGNTPTSVLLNGTTSYTFNVDKSSYADHHTITVSLGSASLTYTNVNTSQSITFPTSWQTQIPNSITGRIVATLTTYNSSNTQLGDPISITLIGQVPASVVPTLSITHSRVNDNATVAAWDLLLQGYSKIAFTANATGVGGSTISQISFIGAGLNQTGTATTATSDTIIVNGTQTWTVTATDTRGRTATQTYSEIVYEYSLPRIASVEVYRCDSDGTLNAETGTYCLFKCHYGISRANGNNTSTSRTVQSKLSTSSTWTTVLSNYTVDTAVVVNGTYNVDKEYNFKITIVDSLGGTMSADAVLQSVSGFSIGLKNDRARFGGVPTKAGLQIDWRVYAPSFVQHGLESTQTVSAGSSSTVSVVFDKAFPARPDVIACLYSTQTVGIGDCSAVVYNLSTTGFDLVLVNNYSSDRSIGATWIAVL